MLFGFQGEQIIAQPLVIEQRISAALPTDLIATPAARELALADIRRVAEGLDTAVAEGALTTDEALSLSAADARATLGTVGVEEVDRTTIQYPHPTPVRDRKPLPQLIIEVIG